jgi:Domain of Unknown Function (DUF1080)
VKPEEARMPLVSTLQTSGAVVALALLSMGAAPKPDLAAQPEGARLDADGRPATPGWTALLDGTDLAGFRYQPEFWRVEAGVLIGSTPGGAEHHYLYTERADFSDFELHADVKLVGNNSGVCIRIAPTSFDDVPGYQVDMGEGYWGSLWDERGRGMLARYPKQEVDRILHGEDWNHYYVRAVGHHIEAWLNGVKTIDLVDEPGRLSGPIGFQLCHGDKPTRASFKNVYVRRVVSAN